MGIFTINPVKRKLEYYKSFISKINAFDGVFSTASEAELYNKHNELKAKVENEAEDKDILPEAFALVREVAKRKVGLKHFDVQLLGGIVLYFGGIAEMKTGEGKTLVATLPLYLNYLMGRKGHLITVNDYLAKRDRYWMGPIYEFLGLKVGLLQHDSDYKQRREAYQSDIIYGTNNEFGFDYLRDHMAVSKEQVVQGDVLDYAIVDEVDSIFIDEARTALIISGPAEESTHFYYEAARMAKRLTTNVDFEIDEKFKTISLTPEGIKKIERAFKIDNLSSEKNLDIARHVNQAIRASEFFAKDRDYILKDGEVIIVDEFTGRLLFGRRYSDGLHQAIEAKEGLRIRQENQTLATITIQNFFRMYKRLSGMTGTALTEANELKEIYGLDCFEVPTNKLVVRKDHDDVVYKTEKGKMRSLIDEIKRLYEKEQPALVGTRSIEKSETISYELKKIGISHQVLNAKYHEKEAEIIKHAGERKMVTIATNMAGRGVDIVLGEGVKELGGLFIIGTERHESRRIDNQLRGRSGRQGDNGESRFFLSLEDEILRIFGGDMLKKIFDFMKVDENMPINHPSLTKAIETAQKRVENYNFDIRKHLLEYDNVLNKQREIVYSERDKILNGLDLKKEIFKMIKEEIEDYVSMIIDSSLPLDQTRKEIQDFFKELFIKEIDLTTIKYAFEERDRKEIISNFLCEEAINWYEEREKIVSPTLMRNIENFITLQILDHLWKEHLYNMDALREGIGLRAYGQENPVLAYQFEAFQIFDDMMKNLKKDVIRSLFGIKIKSETAA